VKLDAKIFKGEGLEVGKFVENNRSRNLQPTLQDTLGDISLVPGDFRKPEFFSDFFYGQIFYLFRAGFSLFLGSRLMSGF
jgi:hypothetical protein